MKRLIAREFDLQPNEIELADGKARAKANPASRLALNRAKPEAATAARRLSGAPAQAAAKPPCRERKIAGEARKADRPSEPLRGARAEPAPTGAVRLVSEINGGTTVDEYSVIQDLLVTWRSTSDWVKVVVVTAIPGQILFLIYQLLRLKAEQRAMLRKDRLTEERIIKLVHIELRRFVEAMERSRAAQAPNLSSGKSRLR